MSILNLGSLLVLGESTGTLSLSGVEEFQCAINNMARQTKLSMKIFTQEFDRELYDNPDFLRIASDVARNRKNVPIRILLKNPGKAAQLGHRMVELQRRVPSCIEIRSFPFEIIEDMDEFLLVDNVGLVKRYTHGHMRGFCEFRAIPDAAKKARYFDSAWDRAEPCQELRRLSP
jgi:hypothetical protein